MLGSLYSAVSGLSAHQTKMNVIGNNIANINTYGFKSSRVTFTDTFYQTLSTASASSSTSGGTNPTQLGYGSQVNSVDVINTRAGSATTDRALDVYINGDGYLAVQDSDGAVKYTRVGILSFDSSGNLADSNGNIVLGLKYDSTTDTVELNDDGTTDTSGLQAISVTPAYYSTLTDIAIAEDGAITATEEGDPEITLSSGTSWIDGTALTQTSNYTGDIKLTVATATTAYTAGTVTAGVSVPANLDIKGNLSINYTGSGYTLSGTNTDGSSFTSAAGTLSGSDYTFSVPTVPSGTGTVTITTGTGGYFATAAWTSPTTGESKVLGTVAATSKTVSGTTNNKAGDSVTLGPATWTTGNTNISMGDITLTVDSTALNALNDFTSTTIGSAGAGDGVTKTIAYLAMVKFTNSDGLSQDGEGYFTDTTNSGDAVATKAGNGGTGSLISGALEMSNVDLSQELTEMIITQRGFQANSKMITVSDEMLDTLVNMKR